VGDIIHSRVALSNIFGLKKMGAEIILCGPAHLIPRNIEDQGVEINGDIDEVIEWADALNVLRIQRERMGVGIIPSIREYRNYYGITQERLAHHKKEIVIMHPGPINRGVEIDSSIADGEQAIILDQVLNGVAVRMSILYLLLGPEEEIKT
jgi:aspartate carbamoyltransferase catalytic subunit